MKLKTLKDLRWDGIHIRDDEVVCKFRELKAEAVKWVKHYKKKEIDNRFKHHKRDWNKTFQISFIMEFFNLTEEDLK